MNNRFASIASVLSGIPSLNEAAEDGSAQRIAAFSYRTLGSATQHSSEESKAVSTAENSIDSERHLSMPDFHVLDVSSASKVAASVAAPVAVPVAAAPVVVAAATSPSTTLHTLPVRPEEGEIAQRLQSEQAAKVDTMLKEDLFKAIRDNNLDGIQAILSRNRVRGSIQAKDSNKQ